MPKIVAGTKIFKFKEGIVELKTLEEEMHTILLHMMGEVYVVVEFWDARNAAAAWEDIRAYLLEEDPEPDYIDLTNLIENDTEQLMRSADRFVGIEPGQGVKRMS